MIAAPPAAYLVGMVPLSRVRFVYVRARVQLTRVARQGIIDVAEIPELAEAHALVSRPDAHRKCRPCEHPSACFCCVFMPPHPKGALLLRKDRQSFGARR